MIASTRAFSRPPSPPPSASRPLSMRPTARCPSLAPRSPSSMSRRHNSFIWSLPNMPISVPGLGIISTANSLAFSSSHGMRSMPRPPPPLRHPSVLVQRGEKLCARICQKLTIDMSINLGSSVFSYTSSSQPPRTSSSGTKPPSTTLNSSRAKFPWKSSRPCPPCPQWPS